MENWDLVVIGGGPAGLTAGIYGGRSGLSTVVLEQKMVGGEVAVTPWVDNYPGIERISGPELIEKMNKHCRKFGAVIKELEEAKSLRIEHKEKLVETDKCTYSARSVIIATGTRYRTLDVPGEKKFQGRGVSYCALCDGAFFKNKRVIVVGGGNSATKSASYLSEIAASVKLVHRRNQLRAEKIIVDTLETQNVQFIFDSEVKEIKGDGTVSAALLRDKKDGRTEEIEVDGVFVQIGEIPNSQLAKKAGIAIDKHGYIIVDSLQRTNVLGVYSAGDVTNGPVKQIGPAVGQAIVAATESFGHVKQPYYYKRTS